MESVVFRIYASHRQMLLADGYIWKYADGPNAAAAFWTREAFRDRIAVGDGMLGIITGSDGFVNVTLEVDESEPEQDFDAWEYVAEGSIEITDGEMQVASSLGNEAARVVVKAGWYRVRCCQAGGDVCRVQVWQAEAAPVSVLKR